MVERFNGRLSQVLRSHHFNSAEDLGKTLHRFVWLYNHHLPQKALGHQAPVQALKVWKMKAPDLFVKNVRNHPGPGSYFRFRRSGGEVSHLCSDEFALTHIRAIHAEVKGEYGWPRIHKELQARGLRIGKVRVRKLMTRGMRIKTWTGFMRLDQVFVRMPSGSVLRGNQQSHRGG